MELIFSTCLYGNNDRYIAPLLKNDLAFIRKSINANVSFYIYCNVDVKESTKVLLSEYGYEVITLEFEKTGYGAMFIRYIPIIENLNAAICVRDTDCCYGKQELQFINEWLSSTKEFHIIRGHNLHVYPIMGGLFSVKGKAILKFSELFEKNIHLTSSSQYNKDQFFLAKIIYPELVNDSLVHTVRVAYKGENYIHYISDDNFIGETIFGDKKREAERKLSENALPPIEIYSIVTKFITNRVVAKIVTYFSNKVYL